MASKIAIVGAGMAGLSAAGIFRAEGLSVQVFEKSRGFGGRMATRRTADHAFDHGAQYFRARSPEFRAQAEAWAAEGLIAPWKARFVELSPEGVGHSALWGEAQPHYVALPGMSALGRRLAEGVETILDTRIVALIQVGGWRLRDDKGGEFGPFDAVLVATPAAQAAELAPENSPLAADLGSVRMQACFALMLAFEEPFDLGFDAARVQDGAISWISAALSRPGSSGAPGLVVLSSNAWADGQLERPLEDLRARLLDALFALPGVRVPPPAQVTIHRWRYANAEKRAQPMTPIDATRRLALAGDWTDQGRVEAAFLSGLRGARALCRSLQG